MNSFDISSTKKVIWQVGAVQQLRQYCQELGSNHPIVVTDAGLVAAGVIDQALAGLRKSGIEPLIFSDIKADPSEAMVEDAVSTARDHKVDGVIGLGGGSSMDVAKLIAVLVNSSQPLADIYGIGKVKGGRLPLLLIPTTAGTGSEVTPIAIITTGETTKAGVVAPQLLPDLAILDAELTLGLPAQVTAATGIDAMVHAIEAYTSKIKKNLYADMLAREALGLLSANILEAVENGGSLNARANMLLGAMMAGQAFTNAPVAAVHALAYPLGGNYHIPHGLSNSLVLPHVLRFNAPVAAELYAELLPCVGGGSTSSARGCDAFIAYLDDLISAVNLPKHLAAMDIPKSDLGKLADQAMQQQRLLVNNPRELKRDDALAIYTQAY